MPNGSRSKRDVLTVFIGSPGDLQDERREARKVVDRLNINVARNLGLYIELRGWEDTLLGSGRPQARINEDLQDSDLFIGLVWLRWGTPTGEYTSGFEEEYELAKTQREREELEEIWLFFKDVPDDRLSDPGDQLRKVLAFKEAVTARREVLYKSFQSTEDWSAMLYDSLANYLTREKRPQEVGQTGTVSDSEQAIPEEEGDGNDLVHCYS